MTVPAGTRRAEQRGDLVPPQTPPAEVKSAQAAGPSGFDKLARIYRLLEYATFGPLLQRTRLQFLPEMASARRVLVLGDGDGRFCVHLLRAAPGAQVVAVDISRTMLQRVRARAVAAAVAARLTTVHQDATTTLPEGEFDLVCTHFFLDCLSDQEMQMLAAEVRQRCPNGQWIVSEFAVPRGAARWPAWLVVRALYVAFRLLTGLRAKRVPDYATDLRQNGFTLSACRVRAFGLLRAERWQTSREPSFAAGLHPREEEDCDGRPSRDRGVVARNLPTHG